MAGRRGGGAREARRRAAVPPSAPAPRPEAPGPLPVALAGGGVVVVAALVLWVAAGPILTDDFWFHLKMGEVYATQGLWPASDPLLFSAGADAPVPHEWLFDVTLHGLERLVGLRGLRVVHAASVAGILWLAWGLFRREAEPAVAACLAAVVFLALAWLRLVQLRPDLPSIASTLLLYRLVLEPDAGPSRARVAGAVALLVVWANVHSLFLVGPLLLAAALAGLGGRALLARRVPSVGATGARAARLAATLGLGLVATLANPRGAAQHMSFLTASRGGGIWRIPDDWEHFDPRAPGPYLALTGTLPWFLTDLLLLALLVAAALAVARMLRRPTPAALRGADPVLLALALAAVAAILVSIRFLWLAVFPLLFLLRAAAGLRARPRPVAWALAAVTLAIAAAFPTATAFPLVAENLPWRPSAWLAAPYVGHKYHVEGVRFLRDTGVGGRLFNKYAMGGFLGYWLAPRLKTFVDGRYPADVLRDYTSVTLQRGSRPGESFLDVLARWEVDFFFGVGLPMGAGPDQVLCTTTHLEGAPGWLLVSRSVHHAIYLRVAERNRDNLARIAAYYAREGVPFDPERGFDVAAVVRERPDWAVAHELLAPGWTALAAARESPDRDVHFDALDHLGLIYALDGLYADEVALDREATALHPAAPAPQRRLVYGLLRLGRWREALDAAATLRRALPHDPHSAEVEGRARAYASRHSQAGALAPTDLALTQYPLVDEPQRRRLFADFYRARLE